MTNYPTSEKGLRAALAVSRWHLGDSRWAEIIVHAYLNPDDAMRNLAFEKGE